MSQLKQKIKNIRRRVIETCYHFKLGHVGSCLSAVEIISVMSSIDGMFLLGKGHAGVLFYCAIIEEVVEKQKDDKNYVSKIFNKNETLTIRHGKMIIPNMDILSEHPDRRPRMGVYHTTGSLGHALPIAVGHAITGDRVNVLVSDGELNEGSCWEAIAFAQEQELSNLKVFVDCNGYQGYKEADTPESILAKFTGFGWGAFDVNVENISELENFASESVALLPLAYICRSKKNKGFGESNLESHYLPLTSEEYARLKL